MNAQQQFGRVLTAMVTPFTDSGDVDYPAAAALAQDLVELGCDGLVINGTTGESPTTSDEEKFELVRVVQESVGHKAKIVASVGSNDTAHTLELTKEVAQLQPDGLLVVTPYYNKPTQAGIYAHFAAVAQVASAPIMLYDIPGRSGVPIATETMCRLAELPQIIANKDAKGDVYAAQQVMSRTDLAFYSGDDALNLPLLACGAVGVVSVVGHIVADSLRDLVEAMAANDVHRAQEINRALVPIVDAIMNRTQGAMQVKAALDLLHRPGGGAMRLPMVPLDERQRELLMTELEQAGLIA